jgi:hypothetical protein
MPADLPADERTHFRPDCGSYLLLREPPLQALVPQVVSKGSEFPWILGREGFRGDDLEVAKTQSSLRTVANSSTRT